MRLRFLAVASAALLAALPAAAQFYTDGNEPAGVRWMQLQTQDYKVVYPSGLDSLARVYAALLERVKMPVGATAGYYPNQEYKKPLPVVLHPWTANANGMVAWTPRRMELLTTPDFSAPLPAPWEHHLVIHESRHVAQMQYVNARPYRPWSWFFGELVAGAVSSIYCSPAFFEGDAVVAETELTPTGRGRVSSFLEYYRTAFREGDTRDYWKWRYGSIKKFTPDHYTAGYIQIAGMRSVYGAQDFTARYYERIFRKKNWPWPMFVYQKTVKEITGKKFKDSFAEITDTLQQRWKRDEEARAPFVASAQLTPRSRRYMEYTSPCWLGDTLLAVREGLARARELVRIDPDGTSSHLSNFAYSTSGLRASEPLGRVYWSEIRRHERWEQVSWSEIWYAGADGKHCRLSNKTRWYNPSVSPDGMRLAVTEYPVQGGSSLLIIDALDGSVINRIDAPAGLQIVESSWVGEDVYANVIGPSGTTVYNVTGGFVPVLSCGPVSLKDLFTHNGELHFTADLTGVDELYRLRDGVASRLTSLEQGGSYFRFHSDTLLYSAPGADGRYLRTAAVSGLMDEAADWSLLHTYEFADDLEVPRPVRRDSVITVPEPQPYNKLANAFRLHSWAPVYINYDAVDDLSFNNLFSSAGLGATGFFQNDLGSLYGTVAYGALYSVSGWTHLGEAKFTYGGLYPKIEASLGVSSQPASFYFMRRYYSNFSKALDVGHDDVKGVPTVDASLSAYLPLNYSSGGWYRGLVPQLKLAISNDIFSHGKLVPMNRVSASVRGYVMCSTPTACIYPRLGIGGELGLSGRVGITEVFSPNAYAYAYGYLPGFMDNHGIRLSAIAQTPLGDGVFAERYASVMPRGMSGASELSGKMSTSLLQSKLSFDYAFPFLPVDWSGLGPVAYVRNFECTLHADASYFAGGRYGNYILGSAGASVNAVLGNLAWLPFLSRIGVTAWRNWGTTGGFDPWHVEMLFSVDI